MAAVDHNNVFFSFNKLYSIYIISWFLILSNYSKLIPTVLWAQRASTLYVTIDVPDISGEKVTLEANKVHFEGKSGSKEYSVDLELLNEIDTEVITLIY